MLSAGEKFNGLAMQIAHLLARIAELKAKLVAPPRTPTNPPRRPSRWLNAKINPAPQDGQKRGQGRAGVARELAVKPDVTRNRHVAGCPGGAPPSAADQILAHACGVDTGPRADVIQMSNMCQKNFTIRGI